MAAPTESRLLIDTGVTQANRANQIIMRACNSDFNRANVTLQSDLSNVLGGNCVYLPHFLCGETEFDLFNALEAELEEYAEMNAHKEDKNTMVEWSQHMKHENPEFSVTFQRVIATISSYFDVEVYASRLNYYPDGTQWKPFHRDSHAYSKNHEGKHAHKEDFTIGVSFGAQRSLAFLHEKSQVKFLFPQKNGDCFAFSSEVNDAFLHGVPKSIKSVKKRFSIIAWGRRRQLNTRNSAICQSATHALSRIGFDLQVDEIMEKVQQARLGTNVKCVSEATEMPKKPSSGKGSAKPKRLQ
ncbi:hypothetical protein XU18_2588 [Perkinsela sp. CCAP 1560/4]|nr:hypothetical protein XU18_2588 [Perkinsela sp. CCAP 1560/4]|eukprot:KNH06567.1 hypothetical protein XU18_2588 [Perkinsela sp. CCAP 1560/4]